MPKEREDLSREVLEQLITQQLWTLFQQQQQQCALSGRMIHFGTAEELQTASLDRIDSSRGYTPDNVQWIHKDFQWFKLNAQENLFISMCCEVADWHRQKDKHQGKQ